MTAPDRLAGVRLVAIDVDGVLTDGKVLVGPDGEHSTEFSVRDGLGLRMLIEAGVSVAVISGRASEALARRMAQLGVERVIMGCDDKAAALRQVMSEADVTRDQVVCIGDDMPDLAMFAHCGVAVAPADAVDAVRRAAHWVTAQRGGAGVVREVADAVLSARASQDDDAFKIVIPSRYAATRLPGKPLRELAGRPLIEHVWRRASAAGAEEVIVATDDQRIADAVARFGGRALITSAKHPSGTDRLAEVAERCGWSPDTIVVNVQGDEPQMPAQLVRDVAVGLRRSLSAVATAATPITDRDALFRPDVVKVIVDNQSSACYFSRAPIPWVRGEFDREEARLPAGVPFLRHIGLYAYRVATLARLVREPASALEQAERLEQLRALSLGMRMFVLITQTAPPHGVDTEQDLLRVAREMTS